jgi:hypothetical protein
MFKLKGSWQPLQRAIDIGAGSNTDKHGLFRGSKR